MSERIITSDKPNDYTLIFQVNQHISINFISKSINMRWIFIRCLLQKNFFPIYFSSIKYSSLYSNCFFFISYRSQVDWINQFMLLLSCLFVELLIYYLYSQPLDRWQFLFHQSMASVWMDWRKRELDQCMSFFHKLIKKNIYCLQYLYTISVKLNSCVTSGIA